MATTQINSHSAPDNRLCTLQGNKVAWNRSAIMRRAWAHLRHVRKMASRSRPFGAPVLPPMTFGECMAEAWNHAQGVARDLAYLREVQAMTPERRSVLTIEAQDRLGVRGSAALDTAHRACAVAA